VSVTPVENQMEPSGLEEQNTEVVVGGGGPSHLEGATKH